MGACAKKSQTQPPQNEVNGVQNVNQPPPLPAQQNVSNANHTPPPPDYRNQPPPPPQHANRTQQPPSSPNIQSRDSRGMSAMDADTSAQVRCHQANKLFSGELLDDMAQAAVCGDCTQSLPPSEHHVSMQLERSFRFAETCDFSGDGYVSMVELCLFVRCMYCGRQSCKAHGMGRDDMIKSGLPFLILYISQMMKSPEAQRNIIDHGDGGNLDGLLYLGMLCFAIPVHELASAVEAVSAVQLGTADMNPLDMANDIINRGMQQLIVNPGYKGTVQEMMAHDAEGGFDNNALSAHIAHLQQVLDMNAHQDNFAKRLQDTRAIYSTLYTYLSKFIQPARDAENPHVIQADKFVELLESLESGSAHEYENLIPLLQGCIKFLKAMLPECMTTSSAIGLLAFCIFDPSNWGDAKRDFDAIKRDLWNSLSLDYQDTCQYECEVSSTPFQTPPSPEGTRVVVYGDDSTPVPARDQWSPDTTTPVESIPSIWSLQRNLFNDTNVADLAEFGCVVLP